MKEEEKKTEQVEQKEAPKENLVQVTDGNQLKEGDQIVMAASPYLIRSLVDSICENGIRGVIFTAHGSDGKEDVPCLQVQMALFSTVADAMQNEQIFLVEKPTEEA